MIPHDALPLGVLLTVLVQIAAIRWTERPTLAQALAGLRVRSFVGAAVVRRWLRRLRIPARDRDDLVQDTLEAAARSWSTFNPRASFTRWLLGVTWRVASHYKTAAARRELPRAVPRKGSVPEHQEDELAAREASAALRSALVSLEPDQRLIVVRHGIEDLTLDKIARDEAEPVSTLHKRWYRALDELRELLRAPVPCVRRRRRRSR